ncbi:hypothetical protein [Weissella ceti]|nr:hypothetical protein [Weissella ceti]QVK11743.1 hypothetical protein KHQ31_05880 [Weissella ceti]
MFIEMFNTVLRLQSHQFFMRRYALLGLFYCWQFVAMLFLQDSNGVYTVIGPLHLMVTVPNILLMIFVTSFAPLANAIVKALLDARHVQNWVLILVKQVGTLFYKLMVEADDIDMHNIRKSDVNWGRITLLAGQCLLLGMIAVLLLMTKILVYLFGGWLIVAMYESIRLFKAYTGSRQAQ